MGGIPQGCPLSMMFVVALCLPWCRYRAAHGVMVGPLPWLLRVRLVIFRLVLVFALPLDFHGRLRVLRSMFIPGASHGIEASFLAGTSMRKLRAAIFGVVWSRRHSGVALAHVPRLCMKGVVISLGVRCTRM